MPIDRSKFTHDAYIFKREGVRKGRPLGYWQAEGVGREEASGDFFVYLHSTPVGGFDGRIICRKFGEAPPAEKLGDDENETEAPADATT
jgi:hypothetical protein